MGKYAGHRLCYCFALFLLGLMACQGTPTPTPTIEPTATMIAAAATPTLTLTPSPHPATPTSTNPPLNTPTITPIPIAYVTMPAFPTVTPIGVSPLKEVFIQFGLSGGDGGSDTDYYYGLGTPSLVIYTDGQVVVRQQGNWDDPYPFTPFITGYLPPEEMCSFLGQLQATGFFNPIDPIYAFDENTEYSDGASGYYIQIRGPLPKGLEIYGPYTEYLVDEIAAAFNLLTSYQPPTNLSPYIPTSLLLWIEPTQPDVDVTMLAEWPSDLPPLSELWLVHADSELLVEGDLIGPLMALFDNRLQSLEFREGEKGYRLILRPLLPHESPYRKPPVYPYPFNLPFPCTDLELPTFNPTPTAMATPTPVLSEEAETLQGRIVFSSGTDGNEEIYIMYANGTHRTHLTNQPGSDTQPVWSPDGQQIAFVSNRSGYNDIYVMNADGTNVIQLTFGASDKWSPAWSPDGSRIVYVNAHNADFPDYDSEIHWVSVQGGDPVRVTDTDNQTADITPIWLDATTILYSSGVYPDLNLYTIQDDGSNLVLLTAGMQPALSPGGNSLAYVMNTNPYEDILITSLDQFLEGPLIFTALTATSLADYSPAWSPDGQKIIFVSERAGNAELYVMNADGSNPIRLTYTAAAENSPDWTP